jgi:NADP-dependent 3-hydroxy acid dehydrogenase YdfG
MFLSTHRENNSLNTESGKDKMNSMKSNKVILLTGASSGIGYDTAVALAQQGHKVYAAARRVDRMEPLH